jgi:hypothetical protein
MRSRHHRSEDTHYLQISTDNSNRELGQKGFLFVAEGATVDTTDHEDGFYAIKALNTEVTLSVTSYTGDGLTSVTILPGDTLFGRFTSITAVAGSILAYRI